MTSLSKLLSPHQCYLHEHARKEYFITTFPHAPRDIFLSCSAKTDDLIGTALSNNRTSESLHAAVATLNDYADDGIAYFQQQVYLRQNITPACRSGCSYCCHGPVHLTPLELLNIVLHINSADVTVAQRADWQARISSRLAFIGTLAVSDQLQMTIPCPFLCDGSCSIYAVRPLFCRGRNVIGIAACQAGFANPAEPQQYEIIQEQMLLSQCLVLNILLALKKIGLPDQFVDLSLASIMAFDTPDLVERWLDGDNVLSGAELQAHSES